ncbi:MAG: glutathione S-transferase [Candidatus Tokpelaia sp. JSC161]|nr:MAG: glutathione S-transferase [Candidatus Tokpelaia sp. JSC161]
MKEDVKFTLFHHPLSSASRYVRLLLNEYQIAAHLIKEYEWQKRKEFLALNLAGTVPVLLTNETPVCGALVIYEFLDETQGPLKNHSRLFPQNPLARAHVRHLSEWFLIKFENDITRHLVKERVYKQEGGAAPDANIIRKAIANIRPHMEYLNWLSTNHNWLGGASLSYADFAAAATVSVLDYMGELQWPLYPMAKEWYARLKSRPSFRSILSDSIHEITPPIHYTNLDF